MRCAIPVGPRPVAEGQPLSIGAVAARAVALASTAPDTLARTSRFRVGPVLLGVLLALVVAGRTPAPALAHEQQQERPTPTPMTPTPGLVTLTPTPTGTPTAASSSTPTPTRILGDFNGDRFVDIRDYGVWRQNFGQTNCGNPAEADGNCLVDIRDYGVWRQHFGEGTPPGASPPPALGGATPTPPVPLLPPNPALPRQSSSPVDGPEALRAAVVEDRPAESGWRLLAADAGERTVPVIPEADALGLLVGGLLGLGGLAAWRRRRR